MPIVTRVYLILETEITGAMRALASVEVGNCLTVVGTADINSFEALLPSDETKWMSSTPANITYVEGYQANGILLPRKVVEG